MVVGSLLDLGINEEKLRNQLQSLHLEGFEIIIEKKYKMGIQGTDFRVIRTEHHQPSRSLGDIIQLINNSGLSEQVKEKSIQTFKLLAEAEAKVHGISSSEVHFHEVGAIDSIIDVVAAMLCIESLGIEKIYASPLHLGEGFVQCAHGTLPVPAPAVLELLKGIPVYNTGVKAELVTPTGAALMVILAQCFGPLPAMIIDKTGYGLGDRDLEIPNLLRVIKGTTQNKLQHLWILECNIDDMNPQYYSYIFPRLLDQGALDVFVTPIIMKKSRPAHCLAVICDDAHINELEEILLIETTTLGVRRMHIQRRILERESILVPTVWGEIRVKLAYYQGRLLKYAPEYDDLSRIAKESKLPLDEVNRQVQIAIYEYLDKNK